MLQRSDFKCQKDQPLCLSLLSAQAANSSTPELTRSHEPWSTTSLNAVFKSMAILSTAQAENPLPQKEDMRTNSTYPWDVCIYTSCNLYTSYIYIDICIYVYMHIHICIRIYNLGLYISCDPPASPQTPQVVGSWAAVGAAVAVTRRGRGTNPMTKKGAFNRLRPL